MAKTHDRTPTFRFRSDPPGASFQCAVDRGPFRACRSPFTTEEAAPFGPHKSPVRAIATGLVDPTPGKFPLQGRPGH